MRWELFDKLDYTLRDVVVTDFGTVMWTASFSMLDVRSELVSVGVLFISVFGGNSCRLLGINLQRKK